MDEGVDSGGNAGGSLRLRRLISDYPAELASDFRAFYHFGIDDIGKTVSLLEATLLVRMLLRMPESALQAKIAGWDYPITREWVVMAHLWELTAQINSKRKVKPYPNPFNNNSSSRMGKTDLPSSVVKKILSSMNPKEESV